MTPYPPFIGCLLTLLGAASAASLEVTVLDAPTSSSDSCIGTETDDVSLLQVVGLQASRGHVVATPVSRRQAVVTTPFCSTSQRLISPGLVGLAILVLALTALAVSFVWWGRYEFAHTVLSLNTMSSMMCFSATIVESYQISQALGQSMSWSGLSVGLTPGMNLVGVVTGWAFLCWCGECVSVRAYLIVGELCILAGGLLYAAVVMSTAGLFPPCVHGPSLLLLSRAVAGVGGGFLEQHTWTEATLIAKTYDERATRIGQQFLSYMIGTGLGPVAVSFLSRFDTCRGQPPDYLLGGPLWILVGIIGLVAALAYPLAEAEAAKQHAEETQVVSEADEDRLIVVLTQVTCGMRAFVTSGLEVATAVLLEQKGWSHSGVGAIIGGTFLMSIPVSAVHGNLVHGMSVPTSMRVVAPCVALGCFLIFDIWKSYGKTAEVVTLVGGDALLFPCIYIWDAALVGLAMQKVGPRGTLFDENAVNLYGLGLSAVTRLSGAWMARFLVQIGGRSTYAVMQAVTVVVFIIITESIIFPRLRKGGGKQPTVERNTSPRFVH